MATSLPLLNGSISLQDALEEDCDILQQLSYPEKRIDLWLHLYQCQSQIIDVVSRHLNIKPTDFRLGDFGEWIHGSFNACVPIHISKSDKCLDLPERLFIRFPLPYKVGEENYPGNIAEKLRCEAATYIWLQQNLSEIPVPRLFGFGFPGKQSFTSLGNVSLWNRLKWHFRQGVSWISGNTLSRYCPFDRQVLSGLGYLIIEHAEGNMLSDSWAEHRNDQERRLNLFRDLSRVILQLMSIPLPRIGSWTIDDHGYLSLTNRPLTLLLHQSENLQIPTDIPRDLTYTSVEPYFMDLLACHDARLRYQSNSIHDQGDGEAQLAALTMMRALLHHFFYRQFRSGPFFLSLTDIHPSNIFVDDQWHIKCLIDLEWASTRPVEMINPPHWLSDQALDQLAFHLDDFSELFHEFMTCFREEELAVYHRDTFSQILQSSWKTGSYWYFQALESPSTLLSLFLDHIQPRFEKLNSAARERFNHTLMPYWGFNTQEFISQKLLEHETFTQRLKDLFHSSIDNE